MHGIDLISRAKRRLVDFPDCGVRHPDHVRLFGGGVSTVRCYLLQHSFTG